ncbi:MAG: cell division protein FtsQ/DivIB [Elusimicrobia bacterium]|nr:cell division protein FtsQ/DivIB [Elusimicrobiota bacterium]
MPPRRRKKLKVAVRRSHTVYRWRSFAESAAFWVKSVLFVGSAAGLAWGAHALWEKTALLTVSGVRVEGLLLPGWGEDPPIKVGQPLFSFSAGRVERRLLERYPQLETVQVRREWDRVVRLRLVARRPVARIQSGGTWNALDREGAVFPLDVAERELPILVLPASDSPPGPALAFLSALQATKEFWTDGLHKITMSTDGEAVLLLSSGVPVYWGDATNEGSRVAQKARRLQRVLSAPESVGGILYARFIDDRRVVIKPRAAGVKGKESHG